MMVVMPTFAIGKDSRPPEITGIIIRAKGTIPREMGGRVDQPGAVPEQHRSQKYTVDDKRPPTEQIKHYAQRNLQQQKVTIEEPIERVFVYIRCKLSVRLAIEEPRCWVEDPEHVAPPESLLG